VVFVDLPRVPEDCAVADRQLAGDLFEGVAGEQEALDLGAALGGVACGSWRVGDLANWDFGLGILEFAGRGAVGAGGARITIGALDFAAEEEAGV